MPSQHEADLTATDYQYAPESLRSLARESFGERAFVWLIYSTTPLGYYLGECTAALMPGADTTRHKVMPGGKTLFAGWQTTGKR